LLLQKNVFREAVTTTDIRTPLLRAIFTGLANLRMSSHILSSLSIEQTTDTLKAMHDTVHAFGEVTD